MTWYTMTLCTFFVYILPQEAQRKGVLWAVSSGFTFIVPITYSDMDILFVYLYISNTYDKHNLHLLQRNV